IFFIQKKNRKLKLYINYRYFNEAIVKNYYLILLILELIDKLRGAKCYKPTAYQEPQRLDKISELIRIKLTVFKTKYRLFKYYIILFKLINILVTFQAVINYVFYKYLNIFIIVYLNNVLVYISKILKKHKIHVKKVLKKL
ncbi:hypothetical protein K469DRAFT_539433, partial [Zopfia rhizophila CBS 207.26]